MAGRASSNPAAGQPAPVYYIGGDKDDADQLLCDEALAATLEDILGSPPDLAACSEFDARSDIAEVCDELRTLPLLAAHRAVIVRDADAFIKQHRKILEEYCEEPSPSASLVLVCRRLDARSTRIRKLIQKIGVIRACHPPKEGEIAGWIVRQSAQVHGKTIGRPAASRLQRLIGADLQALESELLKLATYVGERRTISLEDVDTLVGLRREQRVFAIAEALLQGDAGRGLEMWEQVWATDKDAPFRAIGGLAWAMRRYLEAKHQQESGAALGALARQFWTTEGELFDRLAAPLETFEEHLRELQQADAGVKTGAHDARSAVDKFIVRRSAAAGRT